MEAGRSKNHHSKGIDSRSELQVLIGIQDSIGGLRDSADKGLISRGSINVLSENKP